VHRASCIAARGRLLRLPAWVAAGLCWVAGRTSATVDSRCDSSVKTSKDGVLDLASTEYSCRKIYTFHDDFGGSYTFMTLRANLHFS
jgi:hypothetical protein